MESDKVSSYENMKMNLTDFLESYSSNGHTLELNTKLASLVSVIKNEMPHLNFVGFYMVVKKEKSKYKLFNDSILEIGPYMSDILATPVIEYGKGVCGTAWEKKEVRIENDVSQCKNYIACDDVTKSEIVLPLMKDNECLGVLDVDSTIINSFNEADTKFLNELMGIVIKN